MNKNVWFFQVYLEQMPVRKTKPFSKTKVTYHSFNLHGAIIFFSYCAEENAYYFLLLLLLQLQTYTRDRDYHYTFTASLR